MIPLYGDDGKFLGSVQSGDPCKHRNGKSTGQSCSDGCCDYYRCEDCGKTFLLECPD